jgi:hypothetical protein
MSVQAYRRYAAECLEMSLGVADPQAEEAILRTIERPVWNRIRSQDCPDNALAR